MKEKVWYMYVVTCSDQSYYCGITTSLDRRVDEHNTKKKGAKYTRSRRPVTLFFSEEFPDRSSALKAEAAFKKLTRRQKLKYMSDVCTARLEKEHSDYMKNLAKDVVGDGSVGDHDAQVKSDQCSTAKSS